MSRFLLPVAQGTSTLLADPLVLLAIVVAVLSVMYLVARRRRDGGGTRAADAGGDAIARRQIQGLLNELHEASRQMSADIDAKAARLEALIGEADARMKALGSALNRTRADDLAQRLISSSEGAEDSGLAALARHREIYEMADSGQKAAMIAQRLQRPAGEVELILALRGSGGHAEARRVEN